ncbi:hypothetical protein [Lysobacter tyrosinilyticus]
MKSLAVLTSLLAAALLAYAAWRADFVIAFAHGDPSIDHVAKTLESAKDPELLNISAVAQAQLASKWSKIAGKYILLFHCSLTALAISLLAVASLLWRTSNNSFKPKPLRGSA